MGSRDRDLIVIRGEHAGAWEGLVFDLSLLEWGEITELLHAPNGQVWEPSGSFEFLPSGEVAEVYRATQPSPAPSP